MSAQRGLTTKNKEKLIAMCSEARRASNKEGIGRWVLQLVCILPSSNTDSFFVLALPRAKRLEDGVHNRNKGLKIVSVKPKNWAAVLHVDGILYVGRGRTGSSLATAHEVSPPLFRWARLGVYTCRESPSG